MRRREQGSSSKGFLSIQVSHIFKENLPSNLNIIFNEHKVIYKTVLWSFNIFGNYNNVSS